MLMTNGNASAEGDTITVTGEFNKVDNWTDAFEGDDLTGYYLPLILTGEKGDIIELTPLSGGTKSLTFGQTDDTDTTMVLILAIDKDNPYCDFKAYDADKTNSTEYTVDCSTCTFGA